MICYLVRHGRDDESVRGGWNGQSLTEEGVQQAKRLAEYVRENRDALDIRRLYTSDLPRARQTAEPVAQVLDMPLTKMPDFREVNNGALAGMDNELAKQKYPGLFWSTLEWGKCYPGGESPKQFCERISHAWEEFTRSAAEANGNVMLVTHSGVIHVILCLLEGRPYTNKEKHRRIPHAQPIAIEFSDGVWREKNDT